MLHHLNFKHLRYFLVVAQEGTIARAAEALAITPQTISGQIKLLEDNLETALFRKQGRQLVLTTAGEQARDYAEQIFAMGEALQNQLKNPGESRRPFNVGIADVLPKLVSYRLLEPVIELDDPVRLQCREGTMETLLADLAAHRVDMVLTDRPVDSTFPVRAYNHLLGECSLSLFAAPSLAACYAENFPNSLNGAPLLMPTDDTVIGASLMKWLHSQHLHPQVVVECVDHALLGTFGQAGSGIFCGPAAMEEAIEQQFNVQTLGRINSIRERFYAISLERRIRHPAVLAVISNARLVLEQEKNTGEDTGQEVLPSI
ncbi:MAG: transcriptional activator NhaR [Marinobacterium sp.]|nr:transcriptional activator NhaR [Marinobacterium sp.]